MQPAAVTFLGTLLLGGLAPTFGAVVCRRWNLPAVDNGHFAANGKTEFQVSDKLFVACDSGYGSTKLISSACLRNGQWSLATGNCSLATATPGPASQEPPRFTNFPYDNLETAVGSGVISWSRLHQAALDGSLAEVKRLLADGFALQAPYNHSAQFQVQPIHAAVVGGNVETVRYMLASQPSLSSVADSYGDYPIHYAVDNGSGRIARNLLSLPGADTEATGSHGLTPLQMASAKGNVRLVRLLIAKGAYFSRPSLQLTGYPVIIAANYSRWNVVRHFVENVAPSQLYATEYPSGRLPVHFAAGQGDIDVVDYLTKQLGVSLEASDYRGRTPLHHATANHRFPLVRWLVVNGADAYQDDADGLLPVHVAAASSDARGVQLFVEEVYGNLTHARDSQHGNLPIHVGAAHDRRPVVEYLMTRDRSLLEETNAAGMTALLQACAANHTALCAWLLDRGADAYATSNDSWTVAHHAAFNDNRRVLGDILRVNDNFTEARSETGDQPIHVAARHDRYEAAAFLLSADARNLEATAQLDLTPLHVAAELGHLDIVQLLAAEGADVLAKADAENATGAMPIHLAALWGRFPVVKYFVENHPQTEFAKSADGELPVAWARLGVADGHEGAGEVVSYLERRNSQPESRADDVTSTTTAAAPAPPPKPAGSEQTTTMCIIIVYRNSAPSAQPLSAALCGWVAIAITRLA